jgi:hypothetical protein
MGHNFAKNQWIKIKLEHYLELSMAKQFTKYQMNTCKHAERKQVRKTVKPLKMAKFKGHNSSKN